jgi:excisionase family DNA binding protein
MPSHGPNRLTSESIVSPSVSSSLGGILERSSFHSAPPLRGDDETMRRSKRDDPTRRPKAGQKEAGGALPLAPLLTVPEVAELLRLHAKTVGRWARSGRLPCYRVGGRVLFSRGDIATFLAERRAD